MVDWDEDGDMDLMVGDTWGYVYWFRNTGTRRQPKLTNAGQIKANGTAIDVGFSSVPVITDWNNDGKKDLMVGTEEHGIRMYLNKGTNSSPQFGDYFLIGNINFFRGHPEVGDLNADGKKDLLVGADGFVYYYQNIGSDASPQFAEPGVKLKTISGSDVQVFKRSRPEMADWDEDGRPDLILGDDDGYVTVFLNRGIPTALGDATRTPQNFELNQNYPNPFGPGVDKAASATTQIPFSLRQAGRVQLAVFDLTGRRIKVLLSGQQSAGRQTRNWDGRTADGRLLPSGVYYYRLLFGNEVQSRKLLLIR